MRKLTPGKLIRCVATHGTIGLKFSGFQFNLKIIPYGSIAMFLEKSNQFNKNRGDKVLVLCDKYILRVYLKDFEIINIL